MTIEADRFTPSRCLCEFCYETQRLGVEFDHHEPRSRLQERMQDIIRKIEERERTSFQTMSSSRSGLVDRYNA